MNGLPDRVPTVHSHAFHGMRDEDGMQRTIYTLRFAWVGLGALIGTGVATSGCSSSKTDPSSEPTRSVTQPIQDGVLDTSHRYAVGLCIGGRTSNPRTTCPGRCSGALILPNVVATARHCVSNSPERVDCSTENPSFGSRKGTIQVTTNADMFGTGSEGWYSVKSYEVPDDDHMCGNDIALLVLSSSVPASEATPVVPGVQYVMWDPVPDYAMVFTAIGYGQTSPGGPSGKRYRRELLGVLCVPGSDRLDCPARAKIPENEFIGDDGICSGDSGSSAYELRSYEAGLPVSFGVLSRGGEEDGKCKGSVYTRFDAHRDFVLKVARAASNDWTLYPEPSWTAPKPAPTKKVPAPKDAGAAHPPVRGIGEECSSDAECASKACADTGDGTKICTQSCSEATSSCPEGYECRESLCLPAAPPADPGAAPVTTMTRTTSCAAAPPTSRSFAGWVVGMAVAAIAARRRRTPS